MLTLVGCESEGLGMSVEFTQSNVPKPLPAALAEATAGELRLAAGGMGKGQAQQVVNALTAGFAAETAPAGDLMFVKFSLRNRRMDHPARASAILEASCIWTPAGGSASGLAIEVRTHSIPLEQEGQLKYLRDEALAGMVRELAEKISE
jgi:hypothetical protein